jgi:hypothetical protein
MITMAQFGEVSKQANHGLAGEGAALSKGTITTTKTTTMTTAAWPFGQQLEKP